MKRRFKILCIAVLVIVASSMTCFAAEKQEKDRSIPELIQVDGGMLQLVDSSENGSARGVARYQYHVITDGSNLNVRSGPGTNYSIIGKFRNGQIIDVSFMQDAGIGPWVYAGGVDAITGKYINGYIHEDYYG